MWARKTPKITEVLPLYLHGLSSGDFVPALGQFLRVGRHCRRRSPADRDLAGRAARVRGPGPVRRGLRLLWADGIHVSIRLEEHKLCLLVMIGVRADGRKELIALADGYRGYQRSRGRTCCADSAPRDARPVLAVGDGALGFWNGLREVFPGTREGRCWFHKTANVLAALPKSAHPGAKKALAEIWGAEDKPHALAAVKAFEAAYGAKFPKAVAKICADDVEELLAFYELPAEHWVHLRTTNPIKSTFATVRHRTKVHKGPGGEAQAWPWRSSSSSSARARWRAVNAPHLVALVRAGATFINGKLVERPRREGPARSRLNDLDPQVLTIAPDPRVVPVPPIDHHGHHGRRVYRHAHGDWRPLEVHAPWIRLLGLAILLAATALTLWARLSLGAMWTAAPTVNEEHQLRTSGPYAITRHAITGATGHVARLRAAAGSWAVDLVHLPGASPVQDSHEERLMLAEFP